jgi:hypothetical protein
VKDYNKRLELELLERRRVGRMVVSFLHSQKELMLQAPKNIYKYTNKCSGSVTFWYRSGFGSFSFYQCRVDTGICVISFLHSQKELMLQAPKNIYKYRNKCSGSVTFWYRSGFVSFSFHQCRVDICVVSFLHSQKEPMLQAPKNIYKYKN